MKQNIAVEEAVHERIKKLSKRLGVSMGEYISLCTTYFETNGGDPREMNAMARDIDEIKKSLKEIESEIRTKR